MKKRTRFIGLAMLLFCIQAYAPPPPSTLVAKKETPFGVSSNAKQFTNYTWYRDEEYTEEVGTWCDPATECNRLSLLFSGYTFSTTFAIGLYEYEYGYHPSMPLVKIYSNLY